MPQSYNIFPSSTERLTYQLEQGHGCVVADALKDMTHEESLKILKQIDEQSKIDHNANRSIPALEFHYSSIQTSAYVNGKLFHLPWSSRLLDKHKNTFLNGPLISLINREWVGVVCRDFTDGTEKTMPLRNSGQN